MPSCKICSRALPQESFYKTRTKHRNSGGYYEGFRKECKECTLNRNQSERDLWKDNLFYVYTLPAEHYCGYTNNVRHRINQHKRSGKDTSNFQVVFSSSNQIEAHLIETQYHLNGWNGFNSNIGYYKRRVHTNRHKLLQIEMEQENAST
jgi:hypothetical protein